MVTRQDIENLGFRLEHEDTDTDYAYFSKDSPGGFVSVEFSYLGVLVSLNDSNGGLSTVETDVDSLEGVKKLIGAGQ